MRKCPKTTNSPRFVIIVFQISAKIVHLMCGLLLNLSFCALLTSEEKAEEKLKCINSFIIAGFKHDLKGQSSNIGIFLCIPD